MKVIYFKSELKSYSWNDGLFAIQKNVDGILHLHKIGDNGKLQYYNDGSPNVCCTGENNKGVNETDLCILSNLHEENKRLSEQVKELREALDTVLCRLGTFTESNAWEDEDQIAYNIGESALKQTEQ